MSCKKYKEGDTKICGCETTITSFGTSSQPIFKKLKKKKWVKIDIDEYNKSKSGCYARS